MAEYRLSAQQYNEQTKPGSNTQNVSSDVAVSDTSAVQSSNIPVTTAAITEAPLSETTGIKASAPADFLDLNDKSLVKSIILAEVLGKPKCLRRGRW